jgi:putative aldouronate transport system permease protein
MQHNIDSTQNGSSRSKGVRLYGGLGDKIYMVFVYALLWFALLVVVIPFLFVISSSFSSAEAIAAGKVLLWPVGFNIKGYQMILNTSSIVVGYRNSIFYTVFGTFINIVMTLLLAYPLSRRDFQGRPFITVLMTITMFFSGGMIPTYLLIKNLGMLDTIWAMLIPSALGIWNVIITRTYIQSSIPYELYESASIEGCGDFAYFIKIIIPLSKPIIAVMALLYAVGRWNSYVDAMIYLKSNALYPLQLVLRDVLILNMGLGNPNDVSEQQERLYFGYLLKYSTIMAASAPLMLAYPFVQKHFVKGMMIGSIKG